MRDHSHSSPDDTGHCAHCGQPLPTQQVVAYGNKGINRTGMAFTVLLHLLLVGIYLFKPEPPDTKAAPPDNGAVVYIAPLPPGKPKPKELAQKPSKPAKPEVPVVAKVQRLPDTITLPDEKPEERVEPTPPKPQVAPPELDMTAAIEARRRARGQDTTEQPAEESEADRANRIARANIAAANGRSRGDDANDTGGIFSVQKHTMTATLKFRGWNNNFKRRWLQQIEVEMGGERDLDTAIVKKMIEIIRKEKTGDFDWDSQRLQRVVKLSARVEHTAELHDFLMKEMFPERQRGSRPGAG